MDSHIIRSWANPAFRKVAPVSLRVLCICVCRPCLHGYTTTGDVLICSAPAGFKTGNDPALLLSTFAACTTGAETATLFWVRQLTKAEGKANLEGGSNFPPPPLTSFNPRSPFQDEIQELLPPLPRRNFRALTSFSSFQNEWRLPFN